MKTFKCLLVLLSMLLLLIGNEAGARPRQEPLPVGWHDEMNAPSVWTVVSAQNPPDISAPRKGALGLRLPHVPDNYPYMYQWSGVTRTAVVDLGKYPVLVARVGQVSDGGYAHLDIEERDWNGQTVRTARSNTLNGRGLTMIELGPEWGRDSRRVIIRLIVGGPLAGASCEYDWIRFVRHADLPRLQAAPDWQRVILTP